MRYLLMLYHHLLCLLLFCTTSQSTISSSLFSTSPTPICAHNEALALMQFKSSFLINKKASYGCTQSYPKTNSWKEGTDCCSWDGVTCDNITGQVIGLDLSCSWLHGVIPSNSSLFHLPYLQNLSLAFNDFMGSEMSSEFAGFTSLVLLDLASVRFSGQVTRQISHLSKLVSLDLSGNDYQTLDKHILEGLVRNLTKVRQLFLDGIDMSSIDPNVFMNVSTSLTHLSLNKCDLRGQLSANIFHIPNLKWLDLGSNQNLSLYLPEFNRSNHLRLLDLSDTSLSGELPDSIGNLWSLNYLDLSTTSLSGVLPISVGNLVSLEMLFLEECNLSGILPRSLGNLSQLTDLWLLQNYFSGEIPSSLTNLTQLQFLDISVNQLEGSILDLSSNFLKGTLPSWLYTTSIMDSPFYLNLSHNSLTEVGQLPWKKINTLDLSSNLIEGDLPIPPSTTSIFLISNNDLSGEISDLICNVSSLEILDMSFNNLSGIIPPCFGNFAKNLSMLNLRMNKLHGTIPSTFAKGCQLENLNLNSNQLEGPLSRSILNCRRLQVLDLGNNKINDTFPHWLGTLQELQVLVLQSNQMHGSLHDRSLTRSFSKLQIFDLSNNSFTGKLPTRYIENFKAMMMNVKENKDVLPYIGILKDEVFYSYSVHMIVKGLGMEYTKVFAALTIIDLSSNKFQGEIPTIIGNLSSIIGLNLSHNSLIGHIPPSFGNLINLEWLDLSSNKLDGKIPEQLLNLNWLSFLNLSKNELVGRIPEGKQFSTFENNSYEGNVGLCGKPLSRGCRSNEAEHPPEPEEEDDSKSGTKFGWKVVLVGYMCGFVFGLAMGYVAFRSGKPKWLVTLVEGKHHHRRLKRSNKNARRRT